MGNVISRVVLVAFAVVGLFTAGLIGTLGVRGKLNRESLAELAGVKDENAEKPAGEESATGDVSKDAAKSNAEDGKEHGKEAAPNGGRAESSPHAVASLASAGLDRIVLPDPFSSEKTHELFEELEATRSELKNQLIAARQKEADLELIRADLNRRWDELDQREQELEESRKGVEADKVDLRDKTVLLEEAEDANLRDAAKKIEKMKAQAAAALLETKDPAMAAKILSSIGDREAGKIMENLKPEFLSKVLEKAINIIRPKSVGSSSTSKDGSGSAPGQDKP